MALISTKNRSLETTTRDRQLGHGLGLSRGNHRIWTTNGRYSWSAKVFCCAEPCRQSLTRSIDAHTFKHLEVRASLTRDHPPAHGASSLYSLMTMHGLWESPHNDNVNAAHQLVSTEPPGRNGSGRSFSASHTGLHHSQARFRNGPRNSSTAQASDALSLQRPIFAGHPLAASFVLTSMIVESENEKARTEKRVSSSSPSVSADAHEVNASGYEDALDRHYSLLSITATALTIDAAWIALGGSLVVASANGGPPGIIYEFIAACAYYFFINASIAELASAIPSSGGVYHYASLTAGPKYGLLTGYFTGLLNFFGWLLGMVSITMIAASAAVEIYAQTHPALHIQSWHVFLAFLLILWACVALVVLGNRVLPALQNIGLFLIVGGGIVTIAVVAAMPRQHASSASVWTEWENTTGWPGGVAFLAGMLNGAYAIGTPDAITHMAEEMPHPRRDLPKAIFMQIILGTLTGLAFAIAIMYGVSDFPAILAASSGAAFPLAAFYAQATGGNTGATVGLLLIVLLELIICTVGGIVTTGRILWTLGRDNAVPFAGTLGRASVKRSCPVYATLAVGVLATVFGAIRLGNALAFNDLVGSFVILTTTSYLLAILPHMLTGRKNVSRGPFWMGRWGYLVNGLAVLCIAVTDVFYCFPYFRPVDASSMNYNFVILLGIVGLSALWWVVHAARHYRGPRVQHLRESVVFVDGER